MYHYEGNVILLLEYAKCCLFEVEMLEERCVAIDTDVYDGFIRVISELVGDVGERLVYRTHMYADADIRKYSPAGGDLAYPEKLVMMRNIANSTDSTSSSVVGQQQQLSAVDMHGLWYPTVKRAVLCLSKLFRCLEVGCIHIYSNGRLWDISADCISRCIARIIVNVC
jgi:hypothetical protein